MLSKLVRAVLAAAIAFGATASEAARVAPMIVEVQPSGRGAIARVELTNPDARTFPVEAQMMRGEISDTGELTLTPADDDFLVFPAQAVVQPNSQQVFRVQYVGDPALDHSELYYLAIRQVPVDMSVAQNQVQVVVNFNVLVNVIPDGAVANPEMVSAHPATRNDAAGIEVQIANRGNRYFNAGTLEWRIVGTGADGQAYAQTIPPNEIIRSVGVGVVAPGRTRTFFVPTQRPLADAPIQVTLNVPSGSGS